MKTTTFKELWIWREARALAFGVSVETKKMPYGEPFGMAGQMCRAANSVAACISEGWSRGSTKDYVHYLIMAKGSANEIVSHCAIAGDVRLLSAAASRELTARYERLALSIERCIRQMQIAPKETRVR